MGVNPASATANGAASFAISSPATTILRGGNSQAGSNITFSLLNNWGSGSANTVTLTVAPNAATVNNCTTATSTVIFAAAPTVTATPVAGDTTPTFTASLSNNASDTGGCTASTTDELTITITNTKSGTSTDTFPVTISNISYDVGSTAAIGAVVLAASWTVPTASSAAVPSDATVFASGATTVTANNPALQITQSTTGGPSPIVIAESAAGAVSGTICVSMASGSVPFTFATAGTASASTGAGAGVIVSPPVIVGGNLVATISTPSTAATTYTLSGFTVSDGANTGSATVTVTSGSSGCSTDTTSLSLGVTIFGSAPTLNSAIAGADTDGTAIAELEAAYPIGSGCIPGGKVILATDQNFPDALAASYLAGNLGTGLLLTPTATLSAETASAIQAEGITNVYVVGGPIAINQSVITQLQALPAYTCGGTTKTGSNVTVTGPIFGQTQYDTAQQIATYVTSPAQVVGTANLSGAYGGTYNDTTGMESASPSATGSIRTALVTSGLNFPDATAGSIIAYRNHFPVVLTDPGTLSTQASTTLTALGIKQAIVLGGPLAVSDADVTAIQALGISVIRVAGQDQTDTAQELAEFELNQSSTFTGLGWGATSGGNWGRMILLARGDFYADALAGSVLGTLGGTPILLTENPASLGQYLTTFLNAGGSSAGIDSLNPVSGFSGNIRFIQPLGGALALQFTTLNAAAGAVAAG
jgi:putative cell wall-binding protein